MVAAVLPVKRGLSSPAVTSIPENWDRQWFRYFIDNFLSNADIRNVASTSGISVSGNVSGNSTTGSTNTNVTISLSPIATSTVLGNVSGALAAPVALSQVQLTSLINLFTSTLSGAVPLSGGGIANFLRADGTWNVPAGSGPIPNNTVMGNVSGATAVPVAITQTQLTALINVFTSTLPGAVPASAGGVTTFLRADTTFAVPPNFTSTTPGYVPLSGGGVVNFLRADATFATPPNFTNAAAGYAPASGGGTTNFLRADATWAAPPAAPVGANPTASVGLTTVNGAATTFMRSDAAPSIDVTIAPTWTGGHKFQASGAVTPVVVQGNSLTVALIVNSGLAGTVGGSDVSVRRNGSTINTVQQGPTLSLTDSTANTATSIQHSGGQFELWMTQNNGVLWSQVFKILTTNAIVINNPTGGHTVTINGTTGNSPVNLITPAAGNYPLQFTDGSHIGGFFTSATAGVEVQFGSISNHGLAFFTNNGSPALQIGTGRNVTINVPVSGDTLTVAPSVTSGALMATNAALTTGAGAAAGTLTNAPAAGNPTKWIKINDNGTIRSIPAW